jgi:hypothetical protein
MSDTFEDLLRIELAITGCVHRVLKQLLWSIQGHSACIFRGPMQLGRDVAIKIVFSNADAEAALRESLLARRLFFQ